MIIHNNEVMQPEELTRLGVVFDEAWAAVSADDGQETAERRTALARILLRLANLRQLGPEQLKATALRVFRSDPTEERQSASVRIDTDCPSNQINEAPVC